MTKEIIGIRCTNPKDHPTHQAWRLTFNGQVLGDSRGYAKDRALQEARQEVARDPANRELDETASYGFVPAPKATPAIDPKATPDLHAMSGEEITECLAALAWTQESAGRFFDVDRRTVLRWCNDQKPIPAAVAMLLRLLVAGDVTAAAFVRADRPADSAMIEALEQQARAAATAGNGPELKALLARLEIMMPRSGKHDRFKTLCDEIERLKPVRKAKTSKATARKPRPYHTLLSRDPGAAWVIEFGDYDREVVSDEMRDQKESAKADRRKVDFKIITTGSKQAEVDAAVRELNAAAPAAAAPEVAAPASPLTDIERQAIQGILDSEYMDGMTGQDAVEHRVWSWSANPFKNKRTFSGAISSLVQKGFVVADDNTTKANDRTMSITQKGMDAFLGRTATHVTVNHAPGQPYQIMVHYAQHPAVVWHEFEDLKWIAASVDTITAQLGVPLKDGGVK